MFKEMLFGNCSLAFFVVAASVATTAAVIFGRVSLAWLHLLLAAEIWRRNEP